MAGQPDGDLLGQATEGRLSARVSVFAHESDGRLLRGLVDRMVMAVLAASLGIGSVTLLGIRTGAQVGEVLGLGVCLHEPAAVCGAWASSSM